MIRTFFAAAVSFAAFTPLFASALSPVQPRLIRAPSSSAVYYALPDGRRFTFPNERIYRSWYNDFSTVESVSAQDLASYRLAGAVVYHPGQLVKITTDPKVYAVTQNGVLRWLETESVARRVAGAAWATMIHDLPDELFPAYTIGPSVSETDTAFSLAPLLVQNGSIASNQLLQPQETATTTSPTPGTPTPSQADIILRVSDSRGVLPADSVQLSVFGSGQVPENTRIYVNNLLVQSCTRSPSCSYILNHPTQSSITSYMIRAEGVFANGATINKSSIVPVRDPQAGALRLLVSNSQGRVNTPVDLRAEWKDPLIGAQRLQIMVDGLDEKICFDATSCTISIPIAKSVGQSYDVVAIADDTSGKRWTSPTATIRVVENAAPVLTAGMNASTLSIGESIDINAQASDDDVVTDISIWRNGVRVQSCMRSTCNYLSEPTTITQEERFRITATDRSGNTTEILLDPIIVLPRIQSESTVQG